MLSVTTRNIHDLQKESIDYGDLSLASAFRTVGMPKVVTVEDRGRLVSKVVFEETPLEKMNEGLRVDDFALENLLANGYDLHRMDVDTHSFEDIDETVKGAEQLSKAHAKIKKEAETVVVEPSKNE